MPIFNVKYSGGTYFQRQLENVFPIRYMFNDVEQCAKMYEEQLNEYVNLPEGDPLKIRKYLINKDRCTITIFRQRCKLNHSVCCCLCLYKNECKQKTEEHGMCHHFIEP